MKKRCKVEKMGREEGEREVREGGLSAD